MLLRSCVLLLVCFVALASGIAQSEDSVQSVSAFVRERRAAARGPKKPAKRIKVPSGRSGTSKTKRRKSSDVPAPAPAPTPAPAPAPAPVPAASSGSTVGAVPAAAGGALAGAAISSSFDGNNDHTLSSERSSNFVTDIGAEVKPQLTGMVSQSIVHHVAKSTGLKNSYSTTPLYDDYGTSYEGSQSSYDGYSSTDDYDKDSAAKTSSGSESSASGLTLEDFNFDSTDETTPESTEDRVQDDSLKSKDETSYE